MVEVMSALAVLTVGAAGVIAMQKTTQIANNNARMLATANSIASTWIERLRTEAVTWNDASNPAELAQANWLKDLATSNGNFISPTQIPGIGSNVADINGADLFKGDPETAAFCTHIAMFQLYPGAIGLSVRTVWVRHGGAIDGTKALGADCSEPPARVDTDTTIGYGAVYF